MTNCVSPPELDDLQLAAFVAGEADRVTIDHLAVCPHCREKAARMARTHQSLARPLFRLHCPSPDDLRDFHFGFLPAAQMEQIQHHLQSCARCTGEIVALETFMAATAMAETPMAEDAQAPQDDLWGKFGRRVKTLLAQLSPRPLSGTMMPALSGLRGSPEASQSLYQVGDLQITVQSDRDPQVPEARALLGAIWGGDTDEWTAHLWQEQRLVTTTKIDEFGSFRFTNIPPGNYEIILAGLTLKIRIADVTVH